MEERTEIDRTRNHGKNDKIMIYTTQPKMISTCSLKDKIQVIKHGELEDGVTHQSRE